MLKTDVLVIGCGLAGLSAAINAVMNNTSVILACKSPPGFGTCTMYSAGVLRCACGKYSLERHFIETILRGWYLNDQELVRIMVCNAPNKIAMLKKFGVDIVYGDGRAYVKYGPVTPGRGITKPLVDYANKLGVKILDRVLALDLLTVEDTVSGCIFYDLKKDEVFCILTKSVILATGGYSNLYIRTDNPTGITGDGCAIAFRAGAELSDLEFVQFFPLGLAEENKPIWLFPIVSGKLVNRLGEDIIEKYDLQSLGDSVTKYRDLLSRAMWKEIAEGRGVDDALLLKFSQQAMSEYMELDKLGFSLAKFLNLDKKDVIKVAPLAHFTMGGIKIKTNCSTNIKGLYACGEVASGVHGANRLGGNALTEAVVFGSIAGSSAAFYAKSVNFNQEYDDSEINKWKSRIRELKNGKINVTELRDEIRRLMWNNCGIIRSKDKLRNLISQITELDTKIHELKASNSHEVMKAVETINMQLLARLVSLSALEREESRGAHYREDYPYCDNKNWLKRTVVKLINATPKITYEKVYLKYLSLESDNSA